MQLSLDGTLFSYESLTSTPEAQPQPQFGGGGSQPLSSTTTSTNFSFMGSGFGFGIGYAPSDHVLLGAQLELSHGHQQDSTATQVTSDLSTTRVALLPRVEYVFRGEAARPYFALEVGVESVSTSTASSNATLSSTDYLYGGAFGVHLFLNDYFSFDPALTVLGVSGSGQSDSLAYSS
ncbi:MAG TPA: outer membrane beta-barrel protein, partial [Polyangiaceae bacterium]|nr:outer membrane beta-barrel protein [Polyangiaceae bacterium]